MTTLVIRHPPPPTLNSVMGMHWGTYRRLKRDWVLLVRNAVAWADPPRYERARLTFRLYYPVRRRRDVDNAVGGTVKLLADVLVAAEVLVDDSAERIGQPAVELHVDRAAPRVEIEITEEK